MEEVKKALVVEGGAMRGIFSTGVLDGFLEKNYNPFDFCLGVSAGATNLAAWLCGQKGRNYKVICDYSCRPPFISFAKYLRGGHALDLDWLWEITIREIRLDLAAFKERGIPFFIVATDAESGEAVYIRGEAENLEQQIKASCALPVFYRGFPEVEGRALSDGGVADPIPVIKAYEMGARDITVILSKPLGYRKKRSRMVRLNALLLKGRPGLLETMDKRWEVYNRAIDFLERPPADCRVNIIAPPPEFEVGRLTKDREKLDAGYRMGLAAAGEL